MGFIWGIPYLFIKIAVGELTPASLVFLRTAIGAALLLPIAAAEERSAATASPLEMDRSPTRSSRWPRRGSCSSDAERRISSSLSGLLIALVPSIGAILGVGDRER